MPQGVSLYNWLCHSKVGRGVGGLSLDPLQSVFLPIQKFARYCIVFKVAKAMKACRRSKETSPLRRGETLEKDWGTFGCDFTLDIVLLAALLIDSSPDNYFQV